MAKNVAEYFGQENNLKFPAATNQIYVKDRHVGYEGERETVFISSFYKAKLKFIHCGEDGSLRNSGVEFKFNKPMINNEIIEALVELNSIYRMQKSNMITHSIRTSDHIHINIRDFDEDQLNDLYNNLVILEATLFNVGNIKFDRRKNSYCIPHWIFNQSSGYRNNRGFRLFDMPKYLSFRFCPDFGTIEFRMFESSNTITDQLHRINLCLEIVDSTKRGIILKHDTPIEESLKQIAPKSYSTYYNIVRESPIGEMFTQFHDVSVLFVGAGTRGTKSVAAYMKRIGAEK